MSTPTVSISREIAAPVEKVWSMVTDLPRMGEWSPENQGGDWVKGATGPAVDASFKGRNKNGKRAWSTSVAGRRRWYSATDPVPAACGPVFPPTWAVFG